MESKDVSFSERTRQYCIVLPSGVHLFVEDSVIRKAKHGIGNSGPTVLVCIDVQEDAKLDRRFKEFVARVEPDIVYGPEEFRGASAPSTFVPHPREDILRYLLEAHKAQHTNGQIRALNYPFDDDGVSI